MGRVEEEPVRVRRPEASEEALPADSVLLMATQTAPDVANSCPVAANAEREILPSALGARDLTQIADFRTGRPAGW